MRGNPDEGRCSSPAMQNETTSSSLWGRTCSLYAPPSLSHHTVPQNPNNSMERNKVRGCQWMFLIPSPTPTISPEANRASAPASASRWFFKFVLSTSPYMFMDENWGKAVRPIISMFNSRFPMFNAVQPHISTSFQSAAMQPTQAADAPSEETVRMAPGNRPKSAKITVWGNAAEN